MISTLVSALGLAAAVMQSAAQSVTVCSAGECLTGTSNITRLGAVLTSGSSSYILLPGQYTANVQPDNLQQALASATSTLVFTTGFGNSTSPTTPTLPLNIALQPGLLNYPNDLYAGDPRFYDLPQDLNSTFDAVALNRGSIILAPNTVAAIEANNNGAKSRVVLWDTVPFISQLPYDMAGNLELLSLQSSTCSPACSSRAICSTGGTCICPPNFTGDSCEQCAEGHFGPDCQPCPTGCDNCDAGITGTGACLSVTLPSDAPQNCNCAHGTCSTGTGTCTCAPGWATSISGGNSTQCNICAEGFYLDASGNCSACGARCQACADTTGTCTQCDSNSLTPGAGGNPLQCGLTTTCATNEFLSGTTCTLCNGACASCFGPGASDCLLCAGNNILLNGSCVPVSLTSGAAGICTGTTLVANRAKGVCDVCPPGCSNCAYDAFDQQSTQYSSVRCTRCLPGKFLSEGDCVDTCPDGTYAADDGTCSACSSSCDTCIGSASFCLTCKNNQLASAGTCISNCPTNSFSNSGKCTACHPDCATCSGAGFNQCLTCPESNPVLTSSKRCVSTCAKSEYFDESSGSCRSCDPSCGSCSGAGANSCLSCPSSTEVLRAGECTTVDCGNDSGITAGLGACLAEMVTVPNDPPPVSIPPIDPDAQQPSEDGGMKLTWWQILLIVLGSLFLLALLLLLWRRRQRKKRAKETEQFKQNMKHRGLWSKFFRNPFSAWWARRRAAAINRRSRSDLERRTDKDWRNTQSDPYTPNTWNNPSPLSVERRPATGVPKSIGHSSWITMGHLDGRSLMSGAPAHNNVGRAGLGQIRERDEADRYTTRSGRSGKSGGSYRSRRDDARYDDYRPGESKYWGQEIDQDDTRSEMTGTDQTYLRSGVTGDPYQFERPPLRGSDQQSDLISIIGSEGVNEPWDDRDRRPAYERNRNGYERSELSHPYDERSYQNRNYRQDYPASVSTQSQSRQYERSDYRRGFGTSSSSQGPETPSIYSQPTLPRFPPNAASDEPPPQPFGLSSRFSTSTAAASARPPPKRKGMPKEPIPPLNLPSRQPTEAEMYKMSKIFPDLLGLMNPTKKSPPATTIARPPTRNPFRI